MKKRVLHVIGDLGLGGAQAVLHNLWPSLCDSDRYDFEVCVTRHLGQFGEKLSCEGAVVHCLASRFKYNLNIALKLRRLIRRRGYKIVHAHLFPELYLTSLATVGMRDVRLVYTEHSLGNRRRNIGALARLTDQLAYSRYSRIIAVSLSTRDSFTSWQPGLAGRTAVIPNCIRPIRNDLPGAEGKKKLLVELGVPLEDNPSLILFAGRLSRVKGVDVLLSALAQLPGLNFLLLISGEGEERQNLEAMTASLNLSNQVRFLGFRPDVQQLLRQVDFMVLPSLREGMPIIILEALAAGCPIIATAVGGSSEVLRDKYSGLLVPPGSVNELAGAIKRLINDPSLRNAIARNALSDAHAYFAESASHQLLALYDKVLENHAGRY